MERKPILPLRPRNSRHLAVGAGAVAEEGRPVEEAAEVDTESQSPEEVARDFTINVTPDTLIETEKSRLALNDVALQDYVVVLGNPKGRNINATSITVSNR
jgi:hypothetical protein